MEFSLTRQNPFTPGEVAVPGLLMSGEIRPGDYERLLDFVERSGYHNNMPEGQVILASPGGDIEEALKIGRLVRKLYMSVSVGRETGYCASACFIIFASSVDRDTSPGLVGIHRPYLSRESLRSMSPSQAEAAETSALRDAEQYLRDLRVPRNLIDLMFEQASTEIHWLSEEEFMHQLGRRPAWYEEFLIARCGLDKVAEERALLNGETPTTNIMEPVRCGMELTFNEAEAAYAKIEAPRMIRDLEAMKQGQSGSSR
jgi:hypothetical protein